MKDSVSVAQAAEPAVRTKVLSEMVLSKAPSEKVAT